MDFEQEITKLQDTLVIVAEVQRRQAEIQKIQAAELDAMRAHILKSYRLHQKRMAHIDRNLDEITDKLNGLIGFMDGFPRRPPQ